MDAETFEKYKKAGEISKNTVEALKLKPGIRIFELANEIESEIIRRGAKPAFPVNISINEIAAHYTPEPGDETAIKPDDIVKIDMGVHVDGFIADVAFSYCSEKNSVEGEMIKASENALNEALKAMKPGTKICEISEIIEQEILSSGFRPVNNLTGHNLDKFVFHGPISIPNVKNENKYELKENDVFALEPFATNGSGSVKETNHVMIFRYAHDRFGRMSESRLIVARAKNEFSSLPFCKRWLPISPVKFDLAVKQLVAVGALESYPVLREVGNGKVAQSEHTVIVRDKPLVITRDLV